MPREDRAPGPFRGFLLLRPAHLESHCDEPPQELSSHSYAAALPPPGGHLGHWMQTERIPLGATHKRAEGGAKIGQSPPLLRNHPGALLPRSKSRWLPGG